jgi:Neuraminidase (sialidase)
VARSTDDGVTWTAPTALNSGAETDLGHDYGPDLATDSLGTWVAVWFSNAFADPYRQDYDILVARSTDGGATWAWHDELNTNANTDLGWDLGSHVMTDGQGTWIATWHSEDSLGDTIGTDFDVLVARSTDDGATWSAPTALNTNAAGDAGKDLWPNVATDGQGAWVAVWSSLDSLGDTIGTDADILVARSTDDGVTWTAPAALSANASTDLADDGSPHVTSDGRGAWIAVWYSDDSLGGAIGTDYDILVAHSTDGGATWTAPAALNANAVSDYGNDGVSQVTTDARGTWVAVWRSWDSLGDRIGRDADVLVARSTDDGVTWTAPEALNANASTDLGDDGNPRVATDGQGRWVAIWSSWDSLGDTIGEDADILVAHSTDGGITWTAPAALNTNAATDADEDIRPQLTTDAKGTWVAVWQYEDPH